MQRSSVSERKRAALLGQENQDKLITQNMHSINLLSVTPRLAAAFSILSLLAFGSCGCSSPLEHPEDENTKHQEETPGDDSGKGDDSSDEEQKPDADGYTLVWSDDFDAEALDTDKWRIEVNGDGGGNAELQYYNESGISLGKDPKFDNGALIITARRESCNGKSFVSGRLNTSGHFEFTYGRAEARIRLPKTANGLWPAFWLLGADYKTNSWPRCGEIDIMECGNATGISSGTQDRYFNGACHWGYYKGSAYPNYAKHTTNSYAIQDDEYHLFTIVWTEESIKMYLDRDTHPEAEPYYAMDIVDKSDDWGVGYYFHHDFFIIFNMAVGGYFTGILDPSAITALPSEGSKASMYVDYVRVYQKK